MVHDAGRGCEDDVSELTGWQELDDPLLEIGETNVIYWGDDTSLVQTIISNQQTLSMKAFSNSYRPFSWMTILPDRLSSTPRIRQCSLKKRMSVCCERLNV